MAFIPTLLGTASNTSASTTVVSPSISPTGNALLVVACSMGGSSAGDFTFTGISDTFTGTGTWTQYTISASDATVGRYYRTSIFVAKAGATPGTGTVTVTASANQARKSLSVYEVTTGYNTTTPVKQSKTAENETTPLTITLDATPDADSMVFGAIGTVAETGGVTPGTNFTELDEVDSTGSNNVVLQTQYDVTSATTTCDWSDLVARQHTGVAIEIDAAAGGSTNTKTFTVDGIILVQTTKTFTVDGIIQVQGNTKTFTVDGIIGEQNTKTFTVDGIILAATTKTFTVDGIIQVQGNTKTFTVDGIINDSRTLTFTVDGIILVSASPLTFTVDGVVAVLNPRYSLGEQVLPRPSYMTRQPIFVKTDMMTISGRTTRDISTHKEKFVLVWDYISETEINQIVSSVLELNAPVEFVVDDGNLQIAATQVIPYIPSRLYQTPGGDYYNRASIELVEVE